MDALQDKFKKLGVDNAPGQETRQHTGGVELRGEKIAGTPVDFSHGDVDAFPPAPGSYEAFSDGFREGATQAYTEYRGRQRLRIELAGKLADFSGALIDADREIILTPGTQGALFLAMGANVIRGDKVAIVEPDYFANRKLVEFFEAELVPIPMDYFGACGGGGLDLDRLEACFRTGVRLFLFSNPNNPTGAIYTLAEIQAIATLAERYGVRLIVDELYSRQIFDDYKFTHLRSLNAIDPENLLTLMGPSKTESLSGFRLGAAFGSSSMIERMEKLQAIVSLRAAGYCQAVLKTWFSEPDGWIAARTAAHQTIRDEIIAEFQAVEGFRVRKTEGGSYLFPQMPDLSLSAVEFAKALRHLASVSVTPGTEFGSQFTDSFRINFSQDRRAAVQAIQNIIEIVNRYRI
ncbi:aspartate aminotransferase [Clostridia bacterium]|nr:aspartate aminotransferase [Clostridia bacterium]